jgi:hypothetical protein
VPEPKRINSIGNELLFTADNIVFHKKAGSMEMVRLYFDK